MVTTSIVDASTAHYYRTAAAWEAPGLPLQDQLRSVGAWLDDKRAMRPSIIQVPDGYYLRYRHEGKPHLDHLSMDVLTKDAEMWTQHKRSVKRGSRQELFDAIGHELDQVRAKSVMLDDLGGDWLLTYQCGAPSRGYQSHKQSMTVDQETQQQVVGSARTQASAHGTVSRFLSRFS